MPTEVQTRRLTSVDVRALKGKSKIVAVTAYDYTLARLLDEGGADVLLVGDSLGMVVQGHDTTLPVTVEEMAYHTRAVVRAARRAHVVVDMPFMSYQSSVPAAVEAAGALVKLGGAAAVKLEGGTSVVRQIRAIVGAGIPVMGHVGLVPQSVHAMGGFKVQGRDADDAERILADALAVEAAGAYSIVLEGIPAALAQKLTAQLSIPTIGIGAGAACDGQVLVCYDMLGMVRDRKPKFVRHFAELGDAVVEATRTYAHDVRAGSFPGVEHAFGAALREVPKAASGTDES